jgi:hypothetical protein
MLNIITKCQHSLAVTKPNIECLAVWIRIAKQREEQNLKNQSQTNQRNFE